jgi:SAM-dependent methyltransferase
MRAPIRAFVEAVSRTFPVPGPIVEFGAYRVEGQERLADLRALFPGRAFTGVDLRAGPGVDQVGDVSAAPFADASVGTVLCLETLEHVFEVRRAFDEIHRILAPGGLLVASTPFHFHIHAHPDDYWRLTPSCWAGLLAPYGAWQVGAVGEPSRPHTVLALALKAPAPPALAAALPRAAEAATAAVARLGVERPLAERIAWALKGWSRSKGEQRARASEHEVRWLLHSP